MNGRLSGQRLGRLVLLLAVLAGACATPPQAPQPPIGAPAAELNTLPGFAQDALGGLEEAITRQCALANPPAPWPGLCTEFRRERTQLRAWLERRFVAWPLQGADGNRKGLVTGYYEPVLRGSRTRTNANQVALHRPPADLVRLQDGGRGRRTPLGVLPYYTREQIETSGQFDQDALLWLDDPVDAFSLQIQGSGRVRLGDGSVVRVTFADHNGHPYRAIGTVLVQRGAMQAEEVNADSLKAWLRAHPTQAAGVMQSNPRYIFFRESPPGNDTASPPGSLSVPLTPLRSVATDPRVIPPGAALFLDTSFPSTNEPMQRVVLSQDTGAAITGVVRADLFWGTGDAASTNAGLMKQAARMWLLWPRGVVPPAR